MPTVVAHIQAAPAGWEVRWEIDGVAGDPVVVPPAAVAILTGFEQQFEPAPGLPGGGRARLLPVDHLDAIGREMLATLGGPPLPAGPGELHVRSTLGNALNLPWELLPLATGGAVGTAPAWGVYRLSAEEPAGAPAAATPGPLRVLFLAAAPEEPGQIDYEREEEAVLRAVGRAGNVVVLVAETGSVAELLARVESFKPHVVHLSGHGRMGADGTAEFVFEDERGRPDPRTAEALAVESFVRHEVRLVFFNGSESAQADVAGLCQAFVAAGVPLALGWAAAVADDRATDFTETFYHRLGLGDGVAAAAAHARDRIRADGRVENVTRDGRPAVDVTYVLPRLYAARPGAELFDRTRVAEYTGARTEYVLLPNQVQGLREGFIGRRREQQGLIPGLQDGEFTVAVLHGLGGQGKSTLATRVANRLSGFRVLAVRPKRRDGETVADCARRTVDDLLDEFRAAFLRAGLQAEYDLLVNPKIAAVDKLVVAVDAMNEVAFLLVVDNFEDVLEVGTRAIADDALAKFYSRVTTALTRGSRVIVTTRYLPAGTPEGAPQVKVQGSLQDFRAYDFLKFLRRDAAVERRMRRMELTEAVLAELFAAVGGTPRFLKVLRDTLRTADVSGLLADLKTNTGAGARQRDEYIEGILGGRLFAALTDDGRAVVSRLAVSLLPVPVAAAAVATGLSAARAEAAARDAAAYGLLQEFVEDGKPTLYLPPGLLVTWLSHPDRLPTAEVGVTHRALAVFWREVCEAGREVDVRVAWLDGLDVCRQHAAAGGDSALALWAANRMSKPLSRIGEWRRAVRILEDAIPTAAGDDKETAFALHELASILMKLGRYADAREKFSRSLAIKQRIGDAPGEAATWHQLASIDLNEGRYPDAREKFARALAIKQPVGDAPGEAATWHLLASIDLEEGRYPDAREKAGRSLAIRKRIRDAAGEASTW
ncbi:MAG TPA: tetratricopeptide repeat protein, partial [Urbifossiella sp.]|nr:tetratricopeptide repeat protein [Urbifossiella sp.]